MRKIVLYLVNSQYFLPVSNGMVPVSAARVNEWRETGSEIQVIEGDEYYG